MTAGVQCDTCRAFTPAPGHTWLSLARVQERVSMMDILTGSQQEYPSAFCSWRCLADYAIVRALIEGQPAPEEPTL